MKDHTGKKVFMYVIIGLCLLRLVVLWLEYLQFSYNLDNPLIPKSILTYKLKFDLYLSLFLSLPLMPSLYYIFSKRFFIFLAALSVMLIILPSIAGNVISDIFNAIN